MRLYHFLQLLKNRELDELYAGMALRSFALSMISVFVPIYLLTQGFSLFTVLLFFAFTHVANAASVVPTMKLAERIGFKHCMLLAAPLLIVFYTLLYSLDMGWPLPLLAILFGASHALFWTSYHVDFTKYSDYKHRGEEIGLVNIVTMVFNTVGPVIGGLILAWLGFSALFAIVSVILFLSIAPFFLSGEIQGVGKLDEKKIFSNREPGTAIALFGHGVKLGAALVVWPIFLYLFITNNFVELGALSSVAFVFALGSVLFTGKLTDVNRKLANKLGSTATSLLWVARSIVQTPFHVFVVDAFYGAFVPLSNISLDAITYDKAKIDIANFIAFREICIIAGMVALFTALALVGDLKAAFVLAAIGTLAHLFL